MADQSHPSADRPAAGQDEASATGSRAAAAGLIVLMVIGSVLLCPIAPVGWIWIGSQVQESSQPSLGPIVLAFVGFLVSTILLGKALAIIGRAHAQVTGSADMKRLRLPWLRSLRGERDSGRRTQVLDVVMVTSVSLALLIFGVWFFVFAGSSLPH
jgi:hypothetical protein